MRVGSLFAGLLDGLAIAAEWTWPESTTLWQVDQVGASVRRRHWPRARQIAADVRRLDPEQLPAVDLLCGGFPCQDLSCAGSGRGLTGSRSGLYLEVLRFAGADPVALYSDGLSHYRVRLDPRRRKRPAFLLVENVPPLLRYIDRIREDLAALGYSLSWASCLAADAGAPHLRRRVFLLAELGGRREGEVEVDRARRWCPEQAERTWRTPRASDGRSPGPRSRSDGLDDSLGVQVRTWGMPTAGNHGEGGSLETLRARSRALVEAGSSPIGEPLAMQAAPHAPRQRGEDCRLNPAWVECLMGLPQGWTEPEGRALVPSTAPPWPRGRYPATWDRSRPWPGFPGEPPRTLRDGAAIRGRPARLRGLGNGVSPQQAAVALEALVGRSATDAEERAAC